MDFIEDEAKLVFVQILSTLLYSHIYQKQCAAKSLAQVREIERRNPEVDEGILLTENIKLELPVVRRTSRVQSTGMKSTRTHPTSARRRPFSRPSLH